MPRTADKRLNRLEAREERGGTAEWHRLGRVRFIVAICAEIRGAAIAAGIDPATLPVLRDGEEAATRLAALGDTPEAVRVAEEAGAEEDRTWAQRHPGEPNPRDTLTAELDERGRRYADGRTPPPGGSLWEWHAWARMQPPRPASPRWRKPTRGNKKAGEEAASPAFSGRAAQFGALNSSPIEKSHP
jgi:hypothetical protein